MKRLLLISLLIIPLLAAAQQQGDRSAQFPEGDFLEWVWQRVEFPKAAMNDKITGVCVVTFSISADGELKSPRVTKSPHWSMNEQFVRIMTMSPKWIPAVKKGVVTTERLILRFDMSTKLTDEQLTQMKVVDLYIPPIYSGVKYPSQSVMKFKMILEESIVVPNEQADKDIDTKVDVRFIVDTLGEIKELTVVGENEPLNRAVKMAIEAQSKGWSPATVDSLPLAVPITFSMPLTIERGKLLQAPVAIAEQMPKFQGGGLINFREWVMSKLKYPNEVVKEKISGRVIVSFTVEQNGSITQITTLSSPHKRLSDEVARVLEIAPRWTPGKQGGKPVRVRYTLPVDFRL